MTETWHLLPYHVGPSDLHFALSDALVRHITVPTVWWHSANNPTLILGPTQMREGHDFHSRSEQNVRVVRRQAGGTAVYATQDVLGLDIALPAGHRLALPDVVESYRWIGQAWLDAARSLGVGGRLVSVAEAHEARTKRAPDAVLLARACFGSLSPYEVAVGGRKLIGLAQVRRGGRVLLQAGIHLKFDAATLVRLLCGVERPRAVHALTEAAVGLDEAAGSVYDAYQVMAAFHRTLERSQDIQLLERSWSETEWGHARARLNRECAAHLSP